MESVEWGCKTLQPVLTFDAIDFLTLPCEVGTWAVPSRHGEERDAAAVVAMGVFDGLHLGHRALLEQAKREARAEGTRFVVVTFDPDPSDVVSSSTPARHLLHGDDRVRGLLGLGADAVLVIRFTPDLSSLAPETFVRDVLMHELRPTAVHVGENFRFGYRARGTTETLEELGHAYGFSVRAHGLVEGDGGPVSATRIRALLERGDLDMANDLLRRCHYVRGRVEHGRGEGTSFGFPTANVRCKSTVCMPAEGVYGCYVTFGRKRWPAAVNVGAPPTFTDGGDSTQGTFLEANLVGFDGDLYGADVAVSFVAWLRGSKVFESIDELERTVLGNIAWVRANLGEGELEVHP